MRATFHSIGTVTCAALLAVFALAARDVHAATVPTFKPGDVFARSPNGRIWNITAGGNFLTAQPFASLPASTEGGDIAWSKDLTTMYVATSTFGTVYAITAAGVVTTFATGLTRSEGLLRTADGRLLVAEYEAHEVTDITAGGNFANAAPFASGLARPVALAQLADGRIFATENDSAEISDITAGGVIGAGQVFATSATLCHDLERTPAGNSFMAAAGGLREVLSISSTGAKSVFATNGAFLGLAYTLDGRLLAADESTTAVYDISAGGDMTKDPVFARLPDLSGISSVPVPEPSSAALLSLGAIVLRRRRATVPPASLARTAPSSSTPAALCRNRA